MVANTIIISSNQNFNNFPCVITVAVSFKSVISIKGLTEAYNIRVWVQGVRIRTALFVKANGRASAPSLFFD